MAESVQWPDENATRSWPLRGGPLPHDFLLDASVSTAGRGYSGITSVRYMEGDDQWRLDMTLAGDHLIVTLPRAAPDGLAWIRNADLGASVALHVGASWTDPSWRAWDLPFPVLSQFAAEAEIGRASCRERGYVLV